MGKAVRHPFTACMSLVMLVAAFAGCKDIALWLRPAPKPYCGSIMLFDDLQQASKLPGLTPGDSILLHNEPFDIFMEPETYPVTRRFIVERTQETGTVYVYVVGRMAPTNWWELLDAWRIQTNGVRQELVRPAAR